MRAAVGRSTLIAAALATCLWPGGATPAASDATPSLDEVVVSGERPGPRLWRLTRGDKVLWLLGTPELLPKQMTWRSGAVEALMPGIREVVLEPTVGIKGGPIQMLRLYRQWRRSQESADHASLQATLEPDLHARFLALKGRFTPRDSRIDELRPMLAADRLFDAATEKIGLSEARLVDQTVSRLAKRQRVTVTRPRLLVDEPQKVLDEFAGITGESEIRCLATTIERLESDLGPMIERANAWAIGDIDALTRMSYPDNRAACTDAFQQTPRLAALLARRDSEWLGAVESALGRHDATLALVPMWKLLAPDGVLQRLGESGFRVDAQPR